MNLTKKQPIIWIFCLLTFFSVVLINKFDLFSNLSWEHLDRKLTEHVQSPGVKLFNKVKDPFKSYLESRGMHLKSGGFYFYEPAGVFGVTIEANDDLNNSVGRQYIVEILNQFVVLANQDARITDLFQRTISDKDFLIILLGKIETINGSHLGIAKSVDYSDEKLVYKIEIKDKLGITSKNEFSETLEEARKNLSLGNK